MAGNPAGKNSAPSRAVTQKLYTELRPMMEEALQSAYQRLRSILEDKGFTPTIKYRVKRFKDYHDKLVKLQKQAKSADTPITDLLGLRVVSPFLEDLENIESLICKNFQVIELERKGDIHSFREFGYDSVHLLIRLEGSSAEEPLAQATNVCEVQLRTILQDAWAEVEHELVYKSDLGFPNDSIRRKLASLNASLTLSDLVFQEIRDYQKEVRRKALKRRQMVDNLLEGANQISIDQVPEVNSDATTFDNPDELQNLNGLSLEKMMFKALEAHSNKNFDQAILIYSRILRMKLTVAIRSLVYNHRGMALFAQGDYSGAFSNFTKAIEFDGDNARAYINRGLIGRVQQQYDQSLKDYDTAISLCPEQIDGYWGRAQTCYEMKLFSRALEDCEQILNLQPEFRPAIEFLKAVQRATF
ncbi:MAG TPA: tetratricopeptide repeat protein [Geopsychrobacteraceae bacterium]|nr:tetratricopeptide repeat protein [Geopsychrobacteraceae bacterium]